jgi:hypothetical protein
LGENQKEQNGKQQQQLEITEQQFFGVAAAQRNQQHIGCQALFEGCPAQGWQEVWQQYNFVGS